MSETNETVLVPGEVKRGKYSTEYIFTWVANIIGVLAIAVGAIAQMKNGDQGWALALEIIGALQIALAQLGYTGFRSFVKMTASKGGALVAVKQLEVDALNTNPDGPSGNG